MLKHQEATDGVFLKMKVIINLKNINDSVNITLSHTLQEMQCSRTRRYDCSKVGHHISRGLSPNLS